MTQCHQRKERNYGSVNKVESKAVALSFTVSSGSFSGNPQLSEGEVGILGKEYQKGI